MIKTFCKIGRNAHFDNLNLVQRPYTAITINNQYQRFTQFELKTSRNLFDSASNTNPCNTDYSKRNICKTHNSRNLKISQNIVNKYKTMEANLKWRTDPVITTLDTPQFKSILQKNILDLVALFQKYNYEIRIAGGAVRLESLYFQIPSMCPIVRMFYAVFISVDFSEI